MKHSVACCFLTHDHSDAMKDILDKCLKIYADNKIDICIYDDSNDSKTYELIDSYIQAGADNLFYIDAHCALNGDHKYLLVVQGYNLPKEYDYIWPCKDRVCFAESFIKSIRTAIEEDHDVILGAYEYARWDVGENLTKTIYTNPVEFYRLYGVMTTNWECLIRKKSTMLSPINWDQYITQYNLGGNNSFNQTISLFARLSEMNECSIKICRYTSERYISDRAASLWGNSLYEVWIDKWVAANFSLPAIYDKYKMEVIKSQTNLSELFGSVERMIVLHKEGRFGGDVLEKYRNIWPFVTNIPVTVLEMIASGNYITAVNETIRDFEQAFSDHDFPKAWWLISANTFFEKNYDDRTYRILVGCFNAYRTDMMQEGKSNVFAGISSLQDLLNRYSFVK